MNDAFAGLPWRPLQRLASVKCRDSYPPAMPHPITIRTLFSERLKQLRVSYGQQIGRRLNQADFAAALDLTTECYGAYERGGREPPLKVLATLRRVTGVDLNELIVGQQVDFDGNNFETAGNALHDARRSI